MATGENQSDTPGHLQQCAEAIVGALQGHYWRRHGAAAGGERRRQRASSPAARGAELTPPRVDQRETPCPTPGARRLRDGPRDIHRDNRQ
jgi:hypothetical protein